MFVLCHPRLWKDPLLCNLNVINPLIFFKTRLAKHGVAQCLEFYQSGDRYEIEIEIYILLHLFSARIAWMKGSVVEPKVATIMMATLQIKATLIDSIGSSNVGLTPNASSGGRAASQPLNLILRPLWRWQVSFLSVTKIDLLCQWQKGATMASKQNECKKSSCVIQGYPLLSLNVWRQKNTLIYVYNSTKIL